jgi:UDP-sugar pyrophosphorylase
VPQGENVQFGDSNFIELENIGMEQLRYTAFVLVAGGLGERLGYKGIKIGIPVCSILPDMTFISYYISTLLAMQERAALKDSSIKVPLCIMTSDDTHTATVDLLEKHNYYGMNKENVIIVKQEKVPAMTNVNAQFELAKDFEIITKPHGHGDVHMLLHMHKVTDKWIAQGKKWVLFFQDTNPLIFKCLPSLLAISLKNDFDMNSVTVPRKPGEAVGAICKLTDKSGESLTINVEYNQLEGLLKSSWNKNGDVPGADGYSSFPGNINALLLKLSTYSEALNTTKGLMPEFANPKYADAQKINFKTPTRLECMMQDFPKLFKKGAKVGFSRYERWLCFTTVKNNIADASVKAKSNLSPECASSAESDFYLCSEKYLKAAKVDVEEVKQEDWKNYANIPVRLGPKIVLMPSFALSLAEVIGKFKGKSKVSKKSALVVEGINTVMEDCDVDGSYLVKQSTKGKSLWNGKFINFIENSPSDEEYLLIRGYKPKEIAFDVI